MTKWTAALYFICCLHVSARTFSQQRVTLHLHNAPLITALNSIQQQTNLNVVIKSALLKNTLPVDVDLKDMDVSRALSICFKGQPVTFILTDNTIILK